MKTRIIHILFITLLLVGADAAGPAGPASGESTFTVKLFAQERTYYNHGQVFNWVRFPDPDMPYTKVELVLELLNPLDFGIDGDEWDRTMQIFIFDDEGNRFELARAITPYWNLPFTWRLDITEMQALLHGEKQVMVDLVSWHDDGYLFNVELEFTPGVPPMLPVSIENAWTGVTHQFGVSDINTTFFGPREMTVDDQTDQVLFRNTVTGHGCNNQVDCAAEFMPQSRRVSVNGGGDWFNILWRRDCSQNPTGPQCGSDPPTGPPPCNSPNVCCGTWAFRRAGWCPGDLLSPWIIDVTGQVTPGQAAVIDYDHFRYDLRSQQSMEYVNDLGGSATLIVESQWIELQRTDAMIIVPADVGVSMLAPRRSDTGGERTYWIQNFSDRDIDWVAEFSEKWIQVRPQAGWLAAGASAPVRVTLLPQTDQIPVESLMGTITFTDKTHLVSQQRLVELKQQDHP